jgi:heme exporter protein D
MQFASFNDFLNMGGYAFYVWLSFGLAAILLIYLVWNSVHQHKQVIKQIAQRQQREQKLRSAAQKQMQAQGLTIPEVEPIDIPE